MSLIQENSYKTRTLSSYIDTDFVARRKKNPMAQKFSDFAEYLGMGHGKFLKAISRATFERTMERLALVIPPLLSLLRSTTTNQKVLKVLSWLGTLVGTAQIACEFLRFYAVEEDLRRPLRERLALEWLEVDDELDLGEFHVDKDDLVNETLFRSFIPNVMTVERVMKSSDSLVAKIAEYSEVLTAEGLMDKMSEYYILGNVEGVKMMVSVSPFSMDFFAEEFDDAKKASLKITALLLESLKHKIIEIGGYNPRFGNAGGIKAHDYVKPVVHDQRLFNFLTPILRSSLDKSIKTGVLLYGKPGVSKTTTAHAIIGELDAIKVRLKNSGYDTAKTLLGEITSKKVVIIDDADIEENFTKRSANSELLDFLDSNVYDIILIIVNEPRVHPAIIRAGRCDIKYKCELPDEATIKASIDTLLISHGLGDRAHEVNDIVPALLGKTHAEIHNVIKNSHRFDISLQDAFHKSEILDKIDLTEE